jgi:acyl-CoA thioesterase
MNRLKKYNNHQFFTKRNKQTILRLVTSSTEEEIDSRFPLQDFLMFQVHSNEPGVAEALIEVESRHLNPNGVAHGAVIYAMIDTAMGKAITSVLEDGFFCASIESSIRYLFAVKPGTKLIAQASVLKFGKRVIQLEGHIKEVGGTNRVVAVASGSFAVFKPTKL